MTYKDCLKLIQNNNLDVNQLVVAKTVYDKLKDKINDYDRVCRFIYTCYNDNHQDISIETLVETFSNLLDDEHTEEEILEMRTYNFIEEASYY